MNIDLCFSTVQTILDWVASAPATPTDELVDHFELLRGDIDLKIHQLKKRPDFSGNMGQEHT